MTVAEEVQALRKRLGESTKDFAARWSCSPRTVEGWEQGHREPNAFVLEAMRALAKATKKAADTRTAAALKRAMLQPSAVARTKKKKAKG